MPPKSERLDRLADTGKAFCVWIGIKQNSKKLSDTQFTIDTRERRMLH